MRAELGVTPEEILIVAVGRFVEQKRPLFFLEKALEIQDTCPHAKFLWLGSLPESRDSSERASSLRGPRALQREWTDRVLRAHREKSILLQPWREDVTPFLAAADWYFHTADYEGLPFSLLEAMAASIPVVATRGLAREVGFLDEGNAWFFEDNPAWSALFDSPHIRERAQAARQLIERRFSLARMAREYEALYRRRIEAAARAL
jgi:glycosyltransferase involved in cell wall biosynthesis